MVEAEQVVAEACSGDCNDSVLMTIVESTIRSIRNERPMFSSILNEPIFYARYILPWVREALDQENVFGDIHKKALKGI